MKGPLSGVRVLAVEMAIAGPYGSMLLADLGAEVIRIEPPGMGDRSRLTPGPNHKGDSFYFLAFNRNKKSITLDLGTRSGKEAFYDLVNISDVVWDNARAGSMERLGADYDTLKDINPAIICCSVSGFGSSGPYRDRPSFDLVAQAISGVMSITGEPGGPPLRCGPSIADLVGGMFGVHGVLAALYQRTFTGKGQRVDVALLDGQVSLMAYHMSYYFLGGQVPGPLGSGHLAVAPYGAFKTKEGYLVMGIGWPRVARVLGIEHVIDDPRFADHASRLEHREELDAIVQEAFLKEKAEDWLPVLEVEDIPCGPVNTIDKAVEDPQIVQRNMIVETEHPLGGRLRLVGNPIKMPQCIEEDFIAPPTLGQHNDEILVELLGYSKERIERLRQEEESHAEQLLASQLKRFG